jgi:copper chaperone CopZ
MKTPNLVSVLASALVLSSCSNIPNAREADVMINGNCEQCEETIEKAALQEGVSEADWDKETRHATITYDSTKTTVNAVLQRIANAGYDNQAFIASDSAYDGLPDCCQYKRTGNTVNPPQAGDTRHGH